MVPVPETGASSKSRYPEGGEAKDSLQGQGLREDEGPGRGEGQSLGNFVAKSPYKEKKNNCQLVFQMSFLN